MVLVIDNYDSFVYNLARYVQNIGLKTLIYRNDKITLQEIINLSPSYIVLSPGPMEPTKTCIALDIVKYLYNKIPILGVCLGHQIIGYTFGAKIIRAKQPLHGSCNIIYHNELNLYNKIPNPISVGCYNSLIVDNITETSELKIDALSKNGEIMGLSHKIYPVFGVQFHPESILTTYGKNILRNFFEIIL